MNLTAFDILEYYGKLMNVNGWFDIKTQELGKARRLSDTPAWYMDTGLYTVFERGWEYDLIEKEFTITRDEHSWSIKHDDTGDKWSIWKNTYTKLSEHTTAPRAFNAVRNKISAEVGESKVLDPGPGKSLEEKKLSPKLFSMVSIKHWEYLDG